ncbi:MAG: hypothetical protein HUU10_07495 [Bacteroidetes bacterium]|nr:hypothetical protein [Bacteroidota bacterium]
MRNNRLKTTARLLLLVFTLLTSTHTLWHFHAVALHDHISLTPGTERTGAHHSDFGSFCLLHHTFGSGLTESVQFTLPADSGIAVFQSPSHIPVPGGHVLPLHRGPPVLS